MSKNELALVTMDQFPALMEGGTLDVIQQNMGGEEITPADLTRIKVPAGGGTSWTIETVEGDEESIKALDCVILHVNRRRAYWDNPNPTGDPPSCTSDDCRTGVGTPGGDCSRCPFNQFGSASKPDGSPGRGKACKEIKQLFILRTGELLPEVVKVPAASLKRMKRYQLGLREPMAAVVTRLELAKESNRDGISYAEVKPSKLSVLPPEVAERMATVAQQYGELFAAVSMDADDAGAYESEAV